MKFLVGLTAVFASVYAFTGDERFVRKYAMMKVYESCFGPDVVKEVRMEMQMAASKCSVLAGQPASINSIPASQKHPSKHPHDKNSNNKHGGHKTNNNQLHRLSNKQDSLALASSNTPLMISSDEVATPNKAQTPTIDFEKLQEAILAGYSKPAAGQGNYPMSSNPANSPSVYQPYQGYSSGRPTPYYPPPAPYYPPPSPYQSPQYVPNPAYYQPPMYQPPYPSYYAGRSSRDLDVKGQLETLATRMSGRIQNITCVMQELGYLDANMDPDYARMIERIGRLPVAEELKRDMTEGVEFCRRFSQCLPNDKKDKLVRDMVKPMFFFRCYKHKKLEACIMKDVRERYNGSDEMTEENLTSDARSAKVFPEDMGTAVYEFLYGDGNIDLDSFF